MPRHLRLHSRHYMPRLVPFRGWRRLIGWLPFVGSRMKRRALVNWDRGNNLFTHPSNVHKVAAALRADGHEITIVNPPPYISVVK